ncbi:charged multivesicular body protein 4c-like [Stegastes partitus]|uniref:Charged multivesicular body protein 4c-like n=1 Tax=Stegastes partitus TaxID=144197 RepID=A0A9Y4KL03_9TELE|nr:PREDICTED: charged multivesicular body protein 4c-like [Stegastes partitus]
MALFNGTLGGGETVRKPACQQVEVRELSETEEQLLKKREFLREKIDQELLSAKKNIRTNRKLALEALIRKMRHEKHLQLTDCALTAVKAALKSIEFVQQVSDLMKEHHEAEELPDAVHSAAGLEVDFDEDELLAELEKLQENLDQKPFPVRVSTASPPASEPSQPNTESDSTDDHPRLPTILITAPSREDIHVSPPSVTIADAIKERRPGSNPFVVGKKLVASQ